MNPLIALADTIAAEAHAGVPDKLGVDYIDHPRAVARAVAMEGGSPEAIATALLHDVVEDTDVTLADLRDRGIPPVVVDAVEAITHLPHEPRLDYYGRVRKNAIALRVKRADVRHNQSRLHLLTDPVLQNRLIRKYAEATDALA